MRRSFEDNLILGQIGENTVEHMLKQRGFGMERNCDGVTSKYRGPSLELPNGDFLPRPDLTISAYGVSVGAEVKLKTAITTGIITGDQETGIDHQKWIDYRDYTRKTGLPVFLLFAMYNPDLAERLLINPDMRKQQESGRITHIEPADAVYGEWVANLTPTGISPQLCYGKLVDYFPLKQFKSFWHCIRLLEEHVRSRATHF